MKKQLGFALLLLALVFGPLTLRLAAGLDTNATTGFTQFAQCAGAPTGTPAVSGANANAVWDSTDKSLHFFGGGVWNPVRRIGGGASAADAVTSSTFVRGQHAYPRAVTNKTGSRVVLSGGLGTSYATITAFGSLSGIVVSVYVNGVLSNKTEGVDWHAITSNPATAISLATALSTVQGMSAVAVGSVVYITPSDTTYSLTGTTTDYAAAGMILSFDAVFSADANPSLPAGYEGGAVEAPVVIGGAGLVELSCPVIDIDFASGPFGWLRVTNPVSQADMGPLAQGPTAGIQFWPLSYANGYTDLSNTFMSVGIAYASGQVGTEAIGAGMTVPPLGIGTGGGYLGASSVGADIVYFTAGHTVWKMLAAGGHFIPGGDNAFDMGDSTHRVRALYASSVSGGIAASDAPVSATVVQPRSAFPTATVNTSGADLVLAGGMGIHKFTVVDWTLLTSNSGSLLRIAPNKAGSVTLNRAQHWTAATSNAVTASNIAAVINANGTLSQYVTAVASGADVWLYPKVTCWSLVITANTTQSPGLTATSGTPGMVHFAPRSDHSDFGGFVIEDSGIRSGGSSYDLVCFNFFGDLGIAPRAVGSPFGSNLNLFASDYTTLAANSGTSAAGQSLRVFSRSDGGAHNGLAGYNADLVLGTVTSNPITFKTGDVTRWTIDTGGDLTQVSGTIKFAAGSTGSTTNTLGTNGPNATATPNTWIAVKLSDGSTAYIPAWK